MPRYLAQPCGTSCGPTAAVNALKWAGAKASLRKTLPEAKEGMGWKPYNNGCYDTQIRGTIRKMGKGVLTLHRGPATPATIINHIRNGGAARKSCLGRYDPGELYRPAV